MVKGCNCVACRAARLLGRFKVARGWKERDVEKGGEGMTKKPIIILPQWAEYQIKLKSKIEKQRLKLRKLAGIIRLKNKTIERLEEKAKICDYWKEEYAEEKKVRNEAIMGNILKMNKIIAIRNALTEEYWGPRGVPAWDKKEFTSYDYDDGDAKNTVDRIARILGAED